MKTWHRYATLVLTEVCFLTGLLPADILQPGFDQFQLALISGSSSGATRAWGVGIADFNNDSIPDIIAAATDGDVRFYAGQGDSTFIGGTVVVNQVYYNAFGMATADVNGDDNQDFILTMRDNYPTVAPFTINSGEIHLYLGNGDGTFQSTGFPQAGLVVGDAGTASMAIAAGDIDGDTDIDIIAGDIDTDDAGIDTAVILLYHNLGTNPPTWSAPETIASAQDLGYSPDSQSPPYYPPNNASNLHAYGLALGDFDGDSDLDLLVSDIASYVYLYRNNGGSFEAKPIPYNTISTGTRPYAMMRAHETFTQRLPLACGDLNGDGLVDFVAGGDALSWEGAVDLWLNTGNDTNGWPRFQYAGIIGSAGTDALGVAIGNINPSEDTFLDVIFGNTESSTSSAVYGLRTNRADTDGDGIIDLYDNAPLHANAPRLDMNDDGGINYLDQLDNDQDGTGDPADDDDDNDGVPDISDNSPFVYNPDQTDTDGDGRGDVSDPLNNTDSDGDGIFDGPVDPNLFQKAIAAKAIWSQSDTHFIIRIDALGRQFQNEFTQTFTDGAILTPEEWESDYNSEGSYSYNGIGDEPATAGYIVPPDLPGGKETPVSLVVISKKIWDAYDDPDPIRWMNARISNPNLEIGQHGTYHANNTSKGDWATMTDRNFYACETCGFTLEEMFQYLRTGKRTLLGDYLDWWLQDQGADPDTSDYVDWTNAANPLISYAPPYNTSDTISRDATARLYMGGFSASIWEEQSSIFTPEGSNHEQFDDFGMFHASADLQVNPEVDLHGNETYVDYLDSITQYGQLNTWLIEEVEWSTRYCNDIPRLDNCAAAPGGINRENNMVDPDRWNTWITLLDFVNANGQPMTMGNYVLAVSLDNAPTVANPDQADSDHDGIGDIIDGAVLDANDVALQWNGSLTEGMLQAALSNYGVGIVGQTITFLIDTDNDGTPEQFSDVTDSSGVASVFIQTQYPFGTYTYDVQWDGKVMQLSDTAGITVPCPLAADLTGDCRVRLDDYSILAAQWQQSGDPGNCLLSAELAGDDCNVTLEDLLVMIHEWLE